MNKKLSLIALLGLLASPLMLAGNATYAQSVEEADTTDAELEETMDEELAEEEVTDEATEEDALAEDEAGDEEVFEDAFATEEEEAMPVETVATEEVKAVDTGVEGAFLLGLLAVAGVVVVAARKLNN